jgi:glycosyltransferase involved in cell wall biosynthesis
VRATGPGSLDAPMPDQVQSPAANDAGARCTVVMLAQNEAQRIVEPLRALQEHQLPVLVVDGGSTDETVAIAEAHRARVLHRPFDNMSAQLNWGIEHVGTDYVLVVDADEIMSPELAADIADAIDQGVDGAWVPNIDYFAGRWLTHYPQTHLRLFRRGSGHFEHEIHQRYEFDRDDPTVIQLTGPLVHPSHLDVSGFVNKLNRYTDGELRGDLQARGSGNLLAARAGAEGIAAFGRWYFLRGGWRDGRHGFIHSVYLGAYRFTLWAKAATGEPTEPPTAEAAMAAWRRNRKPR